MSEPAGLRCPGCQQPAELALPGGLQAFCGNTECHVFMWEPDKTLAELAADSAYIDLPDIFPDIFPKDAP
jgi:hypothetical protein